MKGSMKGMTAEKEKKVRSFQTIDRSPAIYYNLRRQEIIELRQ
jgi:hypothetical protein